MHTVRLASLQSLFPGLLTIQLLIDCTRSKVGRWEGLGTRLSLVNNVQHHCYHDYNTGNCHIVLFSKACLLINLMNHSFTSSLMQSMCWRLFQLNALSNSGSNQQRTPWRFFNIFAHVDILSSPCFSHTTINGEMHFYVRTVLSSCISLIARTHSPEW